MKFKTDEYVLHSVGNYQLCFNKHFIIPLNKIREDKIIHTSKKNFLVLRHATLELDKVNEVFNIVDNSINQINMNHIGRVVETDEDKMISSQINNAQLRYISIENEATSFADYKIVIEFDNIQFGTKIESIS